MRACDGVHGGEEVRRLVRQFESVSAGDGGGSKEAACTYVQLHEVVVVVAVSCLHSLGCDATREMQWHRCHKRQSTSEAGETMGHDCLHRSLGVL